MKCDRCEKEEKEKDLHQYGGIYAKSDRFFPKFLCNNCSNEWGNIYSTEWNKNFSWIRFFKIWFYKAKKEKVAFT